MEDGFPNLYVKFKNVLPCDTLFQVKKKFFRKIFHPAFLKTYEFIGMDISFSTFKKIWKNFLIENKLYESDLGAFGVCQTCLKYKREARSSMTSNKSSTALEQLQDHLEEIRICRYCLKVIETFAQENPDQALFIQFDRQDQQTTSLPSFRSYVFMCSVFFSSLLLLQTSQKS